MLTGFPEVVMHSTDVAAFFLSFEARLSVAFSIVSPDHLEHGLGLAGGDLSIFRDKTNIAL